MEGGRSRSHSRRAISASDRASSSAFPAAIPMPPSRACFARTPVMCFRPQISQNSGSMPYTAAALSSNCSKVSNGMSEMVYFDSTGASHAMRECGYG